jgi:hypothetical protein
VASILVDTGVWYSICDPKDSEVGRDVVEGVYKRPKGHTIIIPWPIVYEALRTGFVKNTLALARFEKELKSPDVQMLDDSQYRDDALNQLISWSLMRNQPRPIAMVDWVLRLAIDDTATRIQYLATYNHKDFADVCKRRNVEIIPG